MKYDPPGCLLSTSTAQAFEVKRACYPFRLNIAESNDRIASVGTVSSIEFERTKKIQVGNDHVKAQSERKSHSKNRGGKN